MTTLRIQHIADGSPPVTIQVLQTQPTGEPIIISDHTLHPGEIHHATVRDAQRILIIEPAPTFAEQIERYRSRRRFADALTERPALTDADIDRALMDDFIHA